MSSSTLNHKFLLDENVRVELYRFLKQHQFDVKLVTKSASDSQHTLVSKKQRRILVTNDQDFTHYATDEIFSVVWLRIDQSDASSLIASFEKLLKDLRTFKGKLIILTEKGWEEFPLFEELKI